jgi:hypothetical protein
MIILVLTSSSQLKGSFSESESASISDKASLVVNFRFMIAIMCSIDDSRY